MNKIAEVSDSELMRLAKKVADSYAYRGSIPFREKDDMAMSVLEKFLSKKDKINNSFKGNSKYTTYCIAVLNRMCLEIIRKDIKHWNISEDYASQNEKEDEISSSQQLIIKDEVNYLRKLILLFGAESHKINLFFTYYFKYLVLEYDLENYDSKYIEHNLKEFLSNNEELQKAEILSNLAEVIKLVEDKDIKADAVRMWLNKIRNSIIKRLNMSSKRANYDKESFESLFELYYLQRAK